MAVKSRFHDLKMVFLPGVCSCLSAEVNGWVFTTAVLSVEREITQNWIWSGSRGRRDVKYRWNRQSFPKSSPQILCSSPRKCFKSFHSQTSPRPDILFLANWSTCSISFLEEELKNLLTFSPLHLCKMAVIDRLFRFWKWFQANHRFQSSNDWLRFKSFTLHLKRSHYDQTLAEVQLDYDIIYKWHDICVLTTLFCSVLHCTALFVYLK